MAISEEIYKFFSDYIFKQSGILYAPNDYYRLDSRLNTLKKELGYDTYQDLYNAYKMKIEPRMHKLLIDLATNNETYFFRDNKPFQLVVNKLIPYLNSKKVVPALDIWSAGCSSGQEAYSLTMGIKDGCDPKVFNSLSIDASDISTEILHKAKSGHYTNLEVQRGLPVQNLVKHFNKSDTDSSWFVNDDLKSKIHFFNFNLLTGLYPVNKYDIVFCRNVLIYHNNENRIKMLEGLARSLKPNGFLFMGSGESLIGFNVGLKQKMIDNTMVFVKSDHELDL